MSDYIIRGNYLNPAGEPVVATRMPHPDDTNIIGDGRSWVSRWIRACDDVTIFAHENGGFQWDHGRTRHVLDNGAFVVWTGTEYRTVEPDEFAETYSPVDLPTRPTPPGATS